jgi:hypothetical protein
MSNATGIFGREAAAESRLLHGPPSGRDAMAQLRRRAGLDAGRRRLRGTVGGVPRRGAQSSWSYRTAARRGR